MANYKQIEGYIEDIYIEQTSNGNDALFIKFFSEEAENFPVIRWVFTPATLKFLPEKVERLCKIANVPYTPIQSAQAALKLLSRKELIALEIPISVSPNTYEGVTREQYDIGWGGNNVGTRATSAFASFADEAQAQIDAIKAIKSMTSSTAPIMVAGINEDDIPF